MQIGEFIYGLFVGIVITFVICTFWFTCFDFESDKPISHNVVKIRTINNITDTIYIWER